MLRTVIARKVLPAVFTTQTRLNPIAQQKTIHTEAVQIAFSVYESSKTDKALPPVIIMHGLFGSKQNWRGISKALEAKLKRRIYAVDARNHGDSPHTADHSAPLMAADVVRFIKDRGLSRAIVMGHSMGGRAMMYTALKYPELVDRAIIVDISPLELPHDFEYMGEILRAMKNMKVSSQLNLAEGRKVVANQIADAVGSTQTVNFIMMNLRKRSNGEFYWAANVDSLLRNYIKLRDFTSQIQTLPSYQGPTMFLCGTNSDYMDPDHWPEIQEIFPNSEIHWLNTGHLVHLEEPVKFIELVVKFVDN